MIGNYLKDYKKKFKQECKDFRYKPNHDWRKRWMPMIKYDHDFDGEWFFDLIIHKLNILYDYYDFGFYTMQSEKTKKEILDTLKEAMDLGKKIKNHDYYQGSHEFGRVHCAHIVNIYDKVWHVGDPQAEPVHRIITWRKPKEESESADDLMEDYLAEQQIKKWADENGYDRKDLHTSYSGEWDDIKNHDIWIRMAKDEGKAEQKDIDKFFKLLAKNYRKWWD